MPDTHEDPDAAMRQAMRNWVAAACAGEKRLKTEFASSGCRPQDGQPLTAMQRRQAPNPHLSSCAEPGSASSKEKDGQAKMLAETQRASGDACRQRLDRKYKKRAWKRVAKQHGYSEEYPLDLQNISWIDLLGDGSGDRASL